MNETSIVYDNFRGIDNLNDEQRLEPGKGGSWLVDAQNVHIDNTSQIRTREGYSLLDSGTYHSLFHDKGSDKIYGVRNNNLVLIRPRGTFSYQTIRKTVGSDRFDFVRVGNNVWGTNADIIGYIDEDDDWNSLPSVDQTYKRPMPAGHYIEYFRGRLYVAVGSMIVISDPMGLHFYDERQDTSFIQLRSRVRMLKATEDGLWVADGDQTMFLGGNGPDDFNRKVFNTITVDNTATKDDQNVWFTTQDGICKGGRDRFGNSGTLVNITEKNYNMPDVTTGHSYLKSGSINEYISIVK